MEGVYALILPKMEKPTVEMKFNDLLKQALTLGAEKISPSHLPQFIGLIVYLGLVGVVWASLSLRLDIRLIAAAVALLLTTAVVALLLLLSPSLSPVARDTLAILAVVGFLCTAGYAVYVELRPPNCVGIIEANVTYSNNSPARGLKVWIEGSPSSQSTNGDTGYFIMDYRSEDVHEGNLHLNIEPMSESVEKKEFPVNIACGITKGSIPLRASMPSQPIEVASNESSTQEGDSKPTKPSKVHSLIKSWRDPQTPLIWAETDNGRNVNWIEAEAFCSTMAKAQPGWRLPEIDELATLYDPSQSPRDYTYHGEAYNGAENGQKMDNLVKSGVQLNSCCAWSKTRKTESLPSCALNTRETPETDASRMYYYRFQAGNCWSFILHLSGLIRALCVRPAPPERAN
jgi:hypothetical protein